MSEHDSTESNRSSNELGQMFRERSAPVDFDELKRRWKDCDGKLDTAVRLNARRLRSSILKDGTRSSREIDYNEPLVALQNQLQSERHLFLDWIRRLASLISDFQSKAMVGKFEAAVSRLLRRHRVLRG